MTHPTDEAGRCVWMLLTAIVCGGLAGPAPAADWAQYRGPNLGISDDTAVPLSWSDTDHLRWKRPLPGAGSSSPIVVADKVFVTCYSGYGQDRDHPGEKKNLKRHVVCVDRNTGRILWDKAYPGGDREDDYRGYLREHGYASNTPTSDGRRVYAMLSKSGVVALDMTGRQVWRTSVGTSSASKHWGSAASPILCGDLLIVNASDESDSLIALNKNTGKEVWRYRSVKLEQTFGTPIMVNRDDQAPRLILAVPESVGCWDGQTGKLVWRAVFPSGNNISPSPIRYKDTVIINGGYPTHVSMAIRLGGQGDVTGSHVLWTNKRTACYVPTPVLHGDYLYALDQNGYVWCQDVRTGVQVWRKKLTLSGRGMKCYAAALAIGDHIYAVTRHNGTFVFQASPDGYKPLAHNTLTDKTMFNATPAVSDGQLFLRSDQALYCIGKK